jgi:hypothetical protein
VAERDRGNQHNTPGMAVSPLGKPARLLSGLRAQLAVGHRRCRSTLRLVSSRAPSSRSMLKRSLVGGCKSR